MSDWPFGDLQRGRYTALIVDPPWRYAMGVKSRPQHYPRMSIDEVMALPVRDLLARDGGRVFLWITAPLGDRIGDIARAWRLRYSTMFPWVKVWPSESGMFVHRDSFARGTGFEVVGNAEYVAILKRGRPQSIRGSPFPSLIMAARREHSRKPRDLHCEIEARIAGPYAELFSRETRAGWDAWGYDVGKFDGAAA